MAWHKPDPELLEARRQKALHQARRATAELERRGFACALHGSVLRDARKPHGFHAHSDIDIALGPLRDDDTGAAFRRLVEAQDVAASIVKAAPAIVLPSDLIGVAYPPRPFNAMRVLAGRHDRAGHEIAMLSYALESPRLRGVNIGTLQDYVHENVNLMLEGMLRLGLHARLGWLPEVTEGSYREALLDLAETGLLVPDQCAVLTASGFTDDTGTLDRRSLANVYRACRDALADQGAG